jgi:hypothetical protein
MKKSLSDRIAPVVFAVSIAALGTLYGTVASWWGWFPAPQIGLAHRTVTDLRTNWRNDFALEPTRHLVAPDDSGETADPDRGYRVTDASRIEPGYTLVAGLNTERDAPFHMVRLFDEDGEEVHRWPIRYGLFDEETKPQNVMLHGLELFEDGSLAVTFDAGQAVARVDACGRPIWSTIGRYHHSLHRDGRGNILSWRDDTIVWLDEETGEEVRAIDLRKEVVNALDGEQLAYLDIRTRTPENAGEEIRYLEDPFHPNDAEPLRAEMADAFPMFEAGDVLVSLRELNMIAVIDPESRELKWWQHGPWLKQHDPDFQPDGTITVYDNATGTGSSKIRRIDPETGEMSVDFAGGEEVPFYSWRRGKHQVLRNGNILLTEAEHGRVMEIAPDGTPVWDRHMVWDADSNVIITEARKIPPDFFEGGVPSCDEEIAMAGTGDLPGE